MYISNIIDDCSHFVWTFPLRLKSDTFPVLSNFFAFVLTQFGCVIKTVQCDNGREFDNSVSRAFFLAKGVSLRMSCPYTSQQNGKAERMIRTINNTTRTLLFQASMPSSYWADALATATHLINRLPTKTLHMSTPFFALHGTLPSYHDLRTFGCSCYPNLTATAPHKLAPRSTLCVFLGYPPDHKGYRCLDLNTNRVIISRHVVFDETTFPFSLRQPSPPPTDLDFLTNDDSLPVTPLSAGIPRAAGPPPGYSLPRPPPVQAPATPTVPAVQAPATPAVPAPVAPAVQAPATPSVPAAPTVQMPTAPNIQVPTAPSGQASTAPPVQAVSAPTAPPAPSVQGCTDACPQAAHHPCLPSASSYTMLDDRTSCGGSHSSTIYHHPISTALCQARPPTSNWGCSHPTRSQLPWHGYPWEDWIPAASRRSAHRGPLPATMHMS